MSVKVGIGIATYNRCRSLETCVSAVRRWTADPYILVVADDGSTDETASVCARYQIARLTGKNMGIAWNKNRALFFLHQILDCDVVILFEDDCYPDKAGWLSDWVAAAQRWGHINFAGDWFRDQVIEGSGTVEQPFLSISVSGQCTALSRDALSVCGYLDSRFKSYGYEHAEHSGRLVRSGFGGEMRMAKRGEIDPHFYLLKADFMMVPNQSHWNDESVASNWAAWEKMYGDPVYRCPWRTQDEFRQFRNEMRLGAREVGLPVWRRFLLEASWLRWRAACTPPARVAIL
jgi:glycosyltransferase involved in cell wall biosynthesis